MSALVLLPALAFVLVLAAVPQGRRLFPNLTVGANLALGRLRRGGGAAAGGPRTASPGPLGVRRGPAHRLMERSRISLGPRRPRGPSGPWRRLSPDQPISATSRTSSRGTRLWELFFALRATNVQGL